MSKIDIYYNNEMAMIKIIKSIFLFYFLVNFSISATYNPPTIIALRKY